MFGLRHFRRLNRTASGGLFLLFVGCGDDPTAPPNPYIVDLSTYTQFDFWRVPTLQCLEVGDVYHMVITRDRSSYSATWTWMSGRYCSSGDSLQTYSSLPRALTTAEASLVSATCRTVEIERALGDSCRTWHPIQNCSARWDAVHYGRTCTSDHLTDAMVGRLFALVDSLVGAPQRPMPNGALHAPVAGVGQR